MPAHLSLFVLPACREKVCPARPEPAAANSAVPDPRAADTLLKQVVLDVNAHVVVLDPADEVRTNDDAVIAVARNIDPEVVAVAPFEFVTAGRLGNVPADGDLFMKGVAPGETVLQTDLARYVTEGRLVLETVSNDAEIPVAIGVKLARDAKVGVGDSLPLEELRRDGSAAPARRVRITAILRTPFEEYNQRLVLTSLAAVEALRAKDGAHAGGRVRGVEMKLAHPSEAVRIVKALETKLGPRYLVIDWCTLNRPLLGC